MTEQKQLITMETDGQWVEYELMSMATKKGAGQQRNKREIGQTQTGLLTLAVPTIEVRTVLVSIIVNY